MIHIRYKTPNGGSVEYSTYSMSADLIERVAEQYLNSAKCMPTHLYMQQKYYKEFYGELHSRILTPITIDGNIFNVMQTAVGPILIHVVANRSNMPPLVIGLVGDYEYQDLDKIVEDILL